MENKNYKKNASRLTCWMCAVLAVLGLLSTNSFGQASLYTMAAAPTGVAVTLLTVPIALIATGVDDGSSAVTALPFTFSFGGTAYTQFSVSSNGQVGFGATAVTTAYSNFISSSSYPSLQPFWDDLITNSVNGVGVQYQTFGSAPNRVMKINWSCQDFGSAANVQFQCWLYETSNLITYVYGTGTGGTANVGAATSGASFISVTTATNTASTVTANNSTAWPTSGTSYTFTNSGASQTSYLYSYTTTGSMVTLSVPIALIATGVDDGSSAVTALPFTFTFGGTAYTQFSVSSNGQVGFGATAVTTAYSNFITSSSYPSLQPFWDDLITNSVNGIGVQYQTFGTAPNREMVINWSCQDFGSAANVRFQCWLFESSNIIMYSYGTASAAGGTANVGTARTSADFNSISTATNTNSTVTANNSTAFPATGTLYVFNQTPSPSCAAPVQSAVTAITSSGGTANWTCAACAGSYIIEYGLTGFSPGLAGVAGSGSSTVITALAGATSAALSGLTASSNYQVYIRQFCGGASYSSNSTVQAFTTLANCGGTPTQTAVTAITSSGGTANWTGGSGTYIIEYGLTGFSPGTAGTAGAGGTVVTALAGATSKAITGLASSTAYQVYVRGACAGPLYSPNSAVQAFTTTCSSTPDYTIARTTGNTYTSIMSTGTTFSAMSSADDGRTNNISLVGTTFTYQGCPVTAFSACTNGWMTFNTALGSTAYVNDLTSTASTRVLAPFWDDLVMKGNSLTNQNICMRYQINGTLGSGTADIIMEWAEMERYLFGPPNLHFQVILHESGNTIDFNYGDMQLYDGSLNTSLFTYSVGINGTNPAGTNTTDRLILQREDANFFSSTNQQNFSRTPSCFTRLRFTPAATYSGVDPGAPGVPANNEAAASTNVVVNPSPCTSNCGIIYTSLNATASAGITACSAVTPGTPDDDVWFDFNATVAAPNYRIAVTPSLNYDAVVQILTKPGLVPVTCVNASGVGISEIIASQPLAPGSYYIRVYDAGVGAGGNGEFTVCVSAVVPPPTNDECATATTLSYGATCVPTSSEQPATTSATASASIPLCSAGTPGTPDDDVWYKFTTSATAGVTYTITVSGVSTYNAVLQLLHGACGALTADACVNNTGNGAVETYTTNTLLTSTVYYVRVYHSGAGAANGNFTICVTTPAPACVSAGFTPANGATLVPPAGTTLSWTAVSGASGYDVYFGTNPTPVTLVSSNQAGTTYATGAMAPGTVYYWQIIARNGAVLSTGCSIQSFTTDIPCSGQPNAGSISPSTVTICGSGTTTMTLAGATSGSGISYQWQQSTTSGGPYVNVSTGSGGTTTAYTTATLTAPQVLYYVCVTTCSNSALSNTSNQVTVNVNSIPAASISGSTGICSGGSKVLTALPNGGTYLWSANAANATTQAVTVNAAGTYTVTVTVAGCSASASATTTIVPNPTATAAASPTTVCSGGSTTLTASPSIASGSYCTPTTTNGCLSSDHITNVSFNTISNPSGVCLSNSYSDYTAQNTAVTGGNTYTLSVSVNNGGTEFAGAWIDYNQSGTFDASEFIPLTLTLATTWNGTASVTIPGSAINGSTRLRVRSSYNAAVTAGSSCATYSYGETEDYTVNISGATPQFSFLWSQNPVSSTITSATANPTTATNLTANEVYSVLVTAGNGCTVSASTATVVVNTPPAFTTCPGNQSANTTTACSAVVSYTTATSGTPAPVITYGASGATPVPAGTAGNGSGGTYNVGTTVVTVSASNSCGTTTCTFNVVVTDATSPVATCQNITVQLNPSHTYTVTAAEINNGSTDNCGISSVTITGGQTTYSCSDVGSTYPVTITVTDVNGNSSQCTGNVTVSDATNPCCSAATVSCGGPLSTGTDAGVCSATISNAQLLAQITSSGGSPAPTITFSPAAGSFTSGTTSVTATATNGCGAPATCSFNVIVTDNEAPVITTQAMDRTYECDGAGNTADFNDWLITNWGDADATDNCTSQAHLDQYWVNDYSASNWVTDCGGAQHVYVGFRVYDQSGNYSAWTYATFYIVDTQAPNITFTPPTANLTTDAGLCTSSASIGSATANDVCTGAVTPVASPAGPYSVGTHIITWTATDACGNSSTSTQTVNVTDGENPVITSCPATANISTDAGLCTSSASIGTATATDNCTLSSVVASPAGPYSVGSHTITWTATDAGGNTATCTQTVNVTDGENPVITSCPATANISTDAGLCTSSASIGTATATDNCTVASIVASPAGPYSVGTHTITWTATDAGGLTTTCTQTVNVTDGENPVITSCPATANITTDAGLCTSSASIGTATATDNCSVASIIASPAGPYSVGSHTITWTATDAGGNTATCTQTVNVTDGENPVITCNGPVSVGNTNGFCTATVTLATPGATDNCSVSSVVSNHPSTTYPEGTTTVTWTATDAGGLTATCTQNVVVTVNHATAPTSVTSNDPDNEVCSGTSVLLTANGAALGTAGGSYKWYEGGCGTGSALSSSATLSVTPTIGSHTYYVRIEEPGCPNNTTCASITIVVTGAPPSNTVGPLNGPSEACSGTVSLVTVNSVGGPNIHYSWNTGTNSSVVLFSTNIGGPFSPGPFSTPTNQVYAQFGALGNSSGYGICVQGVNACGSTNNKCLSIRGTVSVPGTITPASGVVACPNDVKNYTAGVSGGATVYNWTLAGSAAPITSGQGTQNVQVTFPGAFTSGQLCVTASLSCGGSSTSAPRCMLVSKTPAVPGAMTGPSAVCPGSTGVTFSVPAVTGASGYTWTTPVGTTITGGQNTTSITVSFPTPYTGAPPICVTANSPCASSVARCKTVGTNLPGQPGAMSGPTTNICASTVQYSIGAVPNASTYQWTNPSGTTITSGQGTTSILLQVASNFVSGNLTVVPSTTLCTPGTGTARTIIIYGKPNIPGTITQNPPGTFCQNALLNFSVTNPVVGPTPTYNWTVTNGAITAGQGSNNVDVTWGSGSGNVNVNATNGCGTSSVRSQTFASGCRMDGTNENGSESFSVYPNPAHDNLTVSIDFKETTGLSIQLMDVSGRVVLAHDETGTAGLNSYNFNLTHLSKGVYMLEVKSANDNWKTRVVIE